MGFDRIISMLSLLLPLAVGPSAVSNDSDSAIECCAELNILSNNYKGPALLIFHHRSYNFDDLVSFS